MLSKFEVEKFFAIRDPQIIDLTVDGKVPDTEARFSPISRGAERRGIGRQSESHRNAST
jgi:hypothetical protein